MTISVDNIERVQFVDAEGRVLCSVFNGPSVIGTVTINSEPESNSKVTEGVRRTVIEYGETLRKLSNE